MTTADAVTRETDWLSASGDGLPSLIASANGPFDNIQAHMARTPGTRLKQIFVLRPKITTARFSNARRIPSYNFHLSIWWPIGSTTTGTPLAEAEQAALDAAIDLLRQRVEGFPFDKTHGGRFMSVAEAPRNTEFTVDLGDPVQGIANGVLTATATYSADDQDYTA
ncbi:hypothetical protein E6W39_24210 [Kitasatospora acidiphila]|uniref:Uncharacterized protein n=1 Tax=Kitasatospora acidiphila TaxID=2567942 RepID=A0A540W6W2_9ACTN|nr:hypothetical protein [Kitasatospora acidiphila]TQF04761.1 hypothetical protein E6W39_24210 [Kitasatospora acidiphila]